MAPPAIARGLAHPRLTVLDGKRRDRRGGPASCGRCIRAWSRPTRSWSCSPMPTSSIRPRPSARLWSPGCGRPRCDMVSEMVALHCRTAGRAGADPRLRVPVPDCCTRLPGSTTPSQGDRGGGRRHGADPAAPRCDRIGGIAAISGALIDDVALARAVKRRRPRSGSGTAPTRARSALIRVAADIWRMVARSAYVQLRRSPLAAGRDHARPGRAVPGAPRRRRFSGTASRCLVRHRWPGPSWQRDLRADAAMLPPARRCWAPLLPAVAAFYIAAAFGSAWHHHVGGEACNGSRAPTRASRA